MGQRREGKCSLPARSQVDAMNSQSGNAIWLVWLLAFMATGAHPAIEPDRSPPAFTIRFPKDGSSIFGSSLDVYGKSRDKSAKVTAFLCDDEGTSTVRDGFVEPNGCLWVEGLRLSRGLNNLTVVCRDGLGNSSFTNLLLHGSSLGLLVDELTSPAELWKGFTTVTGICSDTNRTIFVNGVKAIMNSGGSWKATGVPVLSPNRGGVAVFEVTTDGDNRISPFTNSWVPSTTSAAVDGGTLSAGISFTPVNADEYNHYAVCLGLTNASGRELRDKWMLPKSNVRYDLHLFDQNGKLVVPRAKRSQTEKPLPRNLNIHNLNSQRLANIDGILSFPTNSTVRIASLQLDKEFPLLPGRYRLEVGMRLFRIMPGGQLRPVEFPLISAPLEVVDQPSELVFHLKKLERLGHLAWGSDWNSLRIGVSQGTNNSNLISVYLHNLGDSHERPLRLFLPGPNERHAVTLFDSAGREVPKTALGLQQGQPLSLDDKPASASAFSLDPSGIRGIGRRNGGSSPALDALRPASVPRNHAIECSRFRLSDYFEIEVSGTYRLRLQQRLYQWNTNAVLIGVEMPPVTIPLVIPDDE
jgi:hypothetical protein